MCLMASTRNGCALSRRRSWRSPDAFTHVKELISIMRDGNLSSAQRRHGLFEILKAATGKGKKIKWRGQKQEGKTPYKAGRKPPVKLSSLYKDGDKDKGVVTGAKEVLAEVRAQAAATNGLKETFPTVARELMSCIRPFPEQQPAKADWADDVCT
uniref:Uncharacterized protein n=1 Tax=Phaeocystis antarctica TaxID=33657 RepID=A0A7S0HAW8_9EUKA|mmetsp:Transcript_13300/g.31470  ORF Transcript_13300/g.31470 Transcript_13300/m.31470 type:complete len:155 (+) Transcript_13300:15-479(+)